MLLSGACDRAENKLRILVYSGDDDSVCATPGTQRWIGAMGWTASSEWTGWTVEGQLGGYIQSYNNNFTFATVHGAGHEVGPCSPGKDDGRPESEGMRLTGG